MLNNLAYIVLFQHLPRVGTGTYWKLLDHFPSLKTALEAPLEKLQALLPEEAIDALKEYRSRTVNSGLAIRAEQSLHWAQENSVHLIHMDHPHYPELLRQIKRSPPLLYVLGDPECLSLPQIAIVGSRNPSPAGQSIAKAFAADLASAGFVITSGLALGVDTAAHEGAIKENAKTIAVLGTGIDHVYPVRNKRLAADIIEKGGALVSEFPIGTSALAQNFPQRNRIISGLSSGVLVVEAAIKSGSLITARYALQQDREVFAVPGSINNPLARGCHALIKDGAKLVESSQDIVEELRGFLGLAAEQLDIFGVKRARAIDEGAVPSELEDRVLQFLDYDTTSIDTITQRSGLAVGDVMASLLTMELKGIVAATGTGYMRISEPA